MPKGINIPAFSAFPYRYRNLVERFFNKITKRDGAPDTIRTCGLRFRRDRSHGVAWRLGVTLLQDWLFR
jgi:hypothetical protein